MAKQLTSVTSVLVNTGHFDYENLRLLFSDGKRSRKFEFQSFFFFTTNNNISIHTAVFAINNHLKITAVNLAISLEQRPTSTQKSNYLFPIHNTAQNKCIS